MSEWRSTHEGPVIDCHAHMYGLEQEGRMLEIRESAGIDRMNLLAIQDARTGAGLPGALYMKARHPERFFLFAGLNHARREGAGRVSAPSLADQVDRFVEIGCDGVKMIEGKPTSRRRLPLSFDDDYYTDYFARVEELGLPVLWHVADPEEFWDPERIPGWARERDWGYGEGDVSKRRLYEEVERVLGRHPDLRVIFAHFYFLSADLSRAERFLEKHPGVYFDLAPGIEMLYNISRDPAAGRRFFIRHAEQIVFGTDIQSTLTPDEGLKRAGIVFRWLETDDEFRLPEGTDFLLGPPSDGVIRGMALPHDVLARIYHDNFAELVGPRPKPLDLEAAAQACREIARIASALSGRPVEEIPAHRAAEAIEKT